MTSFTIVADTPFSLAAAAGFGFGPNTGRPAPDGGQMRLAFVTDDLRHHAAVHLTQSDPLGEVVGTVSSAVDAETVRRQVARILSLDHPGLPWLEVGERDPVLGRLQRSFPGLRPVLFHSPYEAAAWSVITTRRPRSQATVVRTRLAEQHGRLFTVAGEQVAAFPAPERLLGVAGFPGLTPVQLDRLHAIARAALDGRLAPAALAHLDPAQALRALQDLPGIGPMYATLILLRATGVTDVMTGNEPRLAGYLAHFYGLSAPASNVEQMTISDGWRPYRTWASVLLRVAGDRAGLPTPLPATSRRGPA